MKNLVSLSSEVMEMFGIESDVSSLRIFTDDSKESVIKLTFKHSVENKWDDGSVENFLKKHPTARMSLGDSWTVRITVPEWYSGIRDFELQPSETIIKDLPGRVKSTQVIFNSPITLSDFKYYAVKEGFIDLEDTDFSISGNKIICRYNDERSVAIRFYSGEKSVGVITIIDHR